MLNHGHSLWTILPKTSPTQPTAFGLWLTIRKAQASTQSRTVSCPTPSMA